MGSVWLEAGMEHYFLSHLDVLEAEAIHIMREVAAEFRRPVMMFSGGKDSICMLRLAEKAFRPARFPFPLLHIDTGHNFPEVIEFRDRRAAQLGERLIVRTVQDAIEAGIATEPTGGDRSRNWLQIPTLLSAIEEFKFDAAFGGARRDEEKARAKERVFSFRDEFGQWDPRNQRPSCGISTTQGYLPASISASFRCPTGLSSTSGSTSSAKVWRSRASILPMKERCSSVKDFG